MNRINRRPKIDALESRVLFAADFATAFTNIDATPIAGNESEPSIAVNPVDPNRLFVAANSDSAALGLAGSFSTDGGATWSARRFATNTDGLAAACCDPSAAFDGFGNLFFAYITDPGDVEILISSDSGATFTHLHAFGGDLDQPTVTAGAGQVWVTFERKNKIVTSGAAVTGLGRVGEFSKLTSLKSSDSGNFGDIAIGPDGQVAVTYQKDASGRNTVAVHVHPDGVGPEPFGKRVSAASTAVGQFEDIPAQPDRGVDAEAALAFDTSTGPFRGRLYLAYTDASSRPKHNLDIMLRYSDDNGASWSAPARVNDDSGTNSQFFPQLVVDPADGSIALTWYDARDDQGATPTPGSPVDLANDQVAIYVARGLPLSNGVALSANERVAGGLSGAANSTNDIELGDFIGLTVANGVMHPAWADNSNSVAGNPDASTGLFDTYTASIRLSELPAADRVFVGGLPARATSDVPAPSTPIVLLANKGAPLVQKSKKAFQFSITLNDADGLDTTRLATAVRVSGPNGFDQLATLRKSKIKKGIVTATYQIVPPSGAWEKTDNGSYSILLQEGNVKDLLGNAAPAGTLGLLVVAR